MTSSNANKKFLVINCEDSAAWSPISFADMFRISLGEEGDHWDELAIAKGESILPDLHSTYHGVVITGSKYNIRDKLSWYDSLCEFIILAANRGYPRMYGGCFGCQIIAVALGGTVGYNPNTRFILKAECIQPDEPAFSKHLQCYDEDKLPFYRVIVSHGDCVHTLPTDAIRIASSISCVNEMYLAGAKYNILAAQAHPEFQLQYAIRDRIWRRVVDKLQRLNEEEVAIATKSFDEFHDDDHKPVIRLISRFLRQDQHNDII